MYKESSTREMVSHHFAYTSINIYLIISCLISIFFISQESLRAGTYFYIISSVQSLQHSRY